MPNKNYLKNLRIPTKENQLRILVSACFVGIKCGFEIISWREYESLEILYSKIDPMHKINPKAQDFDQHDWFLEYFGS